MSKTMTVVQCWDDGVTTDAPVCDVLRRHGAKATFNLNAGLHSDDVREIGFDYKTIPVARLAWNEMREVYDGFRIGNHSTNHPSLAKIPIEEARVEIAENRDRLEQFFQQPVPGFAYPNGSFNEEVMDAIREAGHVYARTTKNVEQPFPPEDAMAFHPCCHFLNGDFWELYERAREGGVFYFWGHSYEIINEEMWADFEKMIERITADPDSQWADVCDLFIE